MGSTPMVSECPVVDPPAVVKPVETYAGAMSRPEPGNTRRLEFTLRRPALALYAGVRPTVVIGGRAQPAQWGTGTWQVPVDETAVVGVFLFNRLWRFGRAERVIVPGSTEHLRYLAPLLPFLRGRIVDQ